MNPSSSNYTDEYLLSRLKKRDESALEILYTKYWEVLYISAYKVLKNKIASEDVVQEIFIDLWEKNNNTVIQNLSAYLYQATKYKVLMVLRKNKISSHHLEVLKRISENQIYSPQHQLPELKEQIIRYMDDLPQKCREVFYMSRFEHITNEEIADQMGISKRTVETHISHAIKHLRGVKELFILLLTSLF